MQTLVLTSLVDVPIAVIMSNKDTLAFRPGSRFVLPVVLINKGESPLGWSQQNPLNLSYRWLAEDGEMLERDGRRTAIPVTQLPPGSRIELEMEGASPDSEGCYQLQLSLVLEGVHWACDIGSAGWVQRVTNVTPAPAWPTNLKGSPSGRALRGAMVAAELARHLEKRTLAVKVAETDSVIAVETWLRALLGLRGLEQQLVDVIALASSQEQRGRELENQIVSLKEELQVDLNLLKGRATQPRENFADSHCDAPLVALEVASRGATANVSQRSYRLSKRSPKRGKSSRKPVQ